MFTFLVPRLPHHVAFESTRGRYHAAWDRYHNKRTCERCLKIPGYLACWKPKSFRVSTEIVG